MTADARQRRFDFIPRLNRRLLLAMAVANSCFYGCTESDITAVQARENEAASHPSDAAADPVPPAPGQTKLVLEDQFFGRVGGLDQIVDYGCAPSNNHLILAVRRDRSPNVIEVIVNGESTMAEGFSAGSITFSPSGQRYAYVVFESTPQGGVRVCSVIDGMSGDQADGLSNVVFSLDDRRTAYVRQQGNSLSLIVDGADQTPRDALMVLSDSVTFSPDSRRLACVANYGKEFALVVDGTECMRFQNRLDPFAPPLFSPTSQEIAFVFGNEDEQCQLICGDRISEPFGNVSASTPIWSPDGTRLAYGVRNDSAYHLVVGDERTGEFEGIGIPRFSPTGNRWGCVFREDQQDVLVVDGRELVRHEAIFGPVFSSDDSQLAYCRREGGRAQLVLNGEPGQDFDLISPDHMSFGPQDRHFVYRALDGNDAYVVIDGEASAPFRSMLDLPVVFSPDGSRYVYAAVPAIGSVTVVVDGEQGEPFEALLVPPTFSPDGRHVAYVARKDGAAFVVVNDEWSKPYDASVNGTSITFTARDRFNICMVHDGEFFSRTHVTINTLGADVGQILDSDEFGVLAESVDRSSQTAGNRRLEAACREGDIGSVLEQFAAGADANSPMSDGCTPLHLASRLSDPSIAMILLRAGADPNVPDVNGLLPLEVLKAHELAPQDARPDEYFNVIQERIQEGIIRTCDLADELIVRGIELEQLRKELILEHELELQMLREQAASYSVVERQGSGYSLPMRYWGVSRDDRPLGWMANEGTTDFLPHPTREYYSTPLPAELYEPLILPRPPQVSEAAAALAYAVWQAELAFGSDDPRYIEFKRGIEKRLGF